MDCITKYCCSLLAESLTEWTSSATKYCLFYYHLQYQSQIATVAETWLVSFAESWFIRSEVTETLDKLLIYWTTNLQAPVLSFGSFLSLEKFCAVGENCKGLGLLFDISLRKVSQCALAHLIAVLCSCEAGQDTYLAQHPNLLEQVTP